MEHPKPWELFAELRLAQNIGDEQSREARLKSVLESLPYDALDDCEALLNGQRAVLLETMAARQKILETAERRDTVHDQLADAEWDAKEEAQRIADLLSRVREAKQKLLRENEQAMHAMLATLYDDDVQALDDFAPPPNDEEEEDGSGGR